MVRAFSSLAVVAALLVLGPSPRAVADPAPAAVVAAPSSAGSGSTGEPLRQLSDKELFGSGPETAATDSPAYMLFNTLAALGLVVALIYVTLHLGARKLLKLGPQPGALVRVVERVPLDAKKSLYVLQAAGEYLLIGGTESSVALLGKLDPSAVEQALAARQVKPPAPGSFLARIQSLSPSLVPPTVVPVDATPAPAPAATTPLEAEKKPE
jgi:flagellar biogenesis protein FliO